LVQVYQSKQMSAGLCRLLSLVFTEAAMLRRLLLGAVLGFGLSGCYYYDGPADVYGGSYYYPGYYSPYYYGYYGPRYYGGYRSYYYGGHGYYRGHGYYGGHGGGHGGGHHGGHR
jgi:hypothetical protein